jgi:hypothetical protein
LACLVDCLNASLEMNALFVMRGGFVMKTKLAGFAGLWRAVATSPPRRPVTRTFIAPKAKAVSMPFAFQDPNYWLDRADDMRIHADVIEDPADKALMLRIAEDYEILARCAHRLAKSHPAKPLETLARSVGGTFVSQHGDWPRAQFH